MTELDRLRARVEQLEAQIEAMQPKRGCDGTFEYQYVTIAEIVTDLGRARRSEIVRRSGFSEATVRRRCEEMVHDGRLLLLPGYPATYAHTELKTDRFEEACHAIAEVIARGDVTRADIVAETGWSDATVRRRLAEMLTKGQVIARGNRPARYWPHEIYSALGTDDPEDEEDMVVNVIRVRVHDVSPDRIEHAIQLLHDCNDVPNDLSHREWQLASYLVDHWYLFIKPVDPRTLDVAFDSTEAADKFEAEWQNTGD